MNTIFALSSGSPPAAIAVVRISGPHAGAALVALSGKLPPERSARLMTLRAQDGGLLDRALVLWFKGPATATGEDLVELHLHGGRAVVAAVEMALGRLPDLRRAQPGEFTRRAFANGRIDLSEAEGLGDLLVAETELQRLNAVALAGGALSARVENWRVRLLLLSAQLEAVLDFDDEDDVSGLPDEFRRDINDLIGDIREFADAPRAEILREGFRVALAGEPNAGKSTLFNALVESQAAITSSIEGTTRDVLERPVAIEGVPLVFVDMAGLRDDSSSEIEAIGIGRAKDQLSRADLVLWLGTEGDGPDGCLEIESRIDLQERAGKKNADHRVSPITGAGMAGLRAAIVERARATMPRPGQLALSSHQIKLLRAALSGLETGVANINPLLMAEDLRGARLAFDSLTGRATTEDMLDTLFGKFCIGK